MWVRVYTFVFVCVLGIWIHKGRNISIKHQNHKRQSNLHTVLCWFSKDCLIPSCQSMCVHMCVCFVWWVRSQQNVIASGNWSCRSDLCGCQGKGSRTSLLQDEKWHFFLSANMLHNTWLPFCHTIKHTHPSPLPLFCSWTHYFGTFPSSHPNKQIWPVWSYTEGCQQIL